MYGALFGGGGGAAGWGVRQHERGQDHRRRVPGQLGRSDELVVVGPEKDGYVNVQGSAAAGWIRTVLVQKR
jgi:hypothetical protein